MPLSSLHPGEESISWPMIRVWISDSAHLTVRESMGITVVLSSLVIRLCLGGEESLKSKEVNPFPFWDIIFRSSFGVQYYLMKISKPKSICNR